MGWGGKYDAVEVVEKTWLDGLPPLPVVSAGGGCAKKSKGSWMQIEGMRIESNQSKECC